MNNKFYSNIQEYLMKKQKGKTNENKASGQFYI